MLYFNYVLCILRKSLCKAVAPGAGNGPLLSLLVITVYITLGALICSQRLLYRSVAAHAVLACLGWLHLLLPLPTGLCLRKGQSDTSGLSRRMARLLSTVADPARQLVARLWHGFIGLIPGAT